MVIVSVGTDVAMNVFAVHGVDDSGKPALVRPSVPRARRSPQVERKVPAVGLHDGWKNPRRTL